MRDENVFDVSQGVRQKIRAILPLSKRSTNSGCMQHLKNGTCKENTMQCTTVSTNTTNTTNTTNSIEHEFVYNGPNTPPTAQKKMFTSNDHSSNRKKAVIVHAESPFFKYRGSESSRNSSTSVASSSMQSSQNKQDIDGVQQLSLSQLGSAPRPARPDSIEEGDENESMSSNSRLDSLTSSPSPTKFAERGLAGTIDDIVIKVKWAPLVKSTTSTTSITSITSTTFTKPTDSNSCTVQPISVQIVCKCHGSKIHRERLEEDQPEWKLRSVEVARDIIASFVEVVQYSARSLEWSNPYILHDIEWANGFCWGGDASYDPTRDGAIVLTADTNTNCPNVYDNTRDESLAGMIRKMCKVLKLRDSMAVTTVGETERFPDDSLQVVVHVNHFCTS